MKIDICVQTIHDEVRDCPIQRTIEISDKDFSDILSMFRAEGSDIVLEHSSFGFTSLGRPSFSIVLKRPPVPVEVPE